MQIQPIGVITSNRAAQAYGEFAQCHTTHKPCEPKYDDTLQLAIAGMRAECAMSAAKAIARALEGIQQMQV